jgi:hypothetical protein
MKTVSTAVTKQSRNFTQHKLTIWEMPARGFCGAQA